MTNWIEVDDLTNYIAILRRLTKSKMTVQKYMRSFTVD